MIDQINSLSAIATEFSNFAKMPQAKNEALEIGKKITDTLRLFENTDNVVLTFKKRYEGEIYVNADKEQLLRAFMNLFKNAIQSVPDSRKGMIEVEARLKQNNSFVLITISDNGKGIEDGMKEKLFQPNFTTKTSGMGLGLAIVKNIVETSGGKIWFETKPGIGTQFFIEFPVFLR